MASLTAYPSTNKVQVGSKTTTYYKTFSGKKYTFIGSHESKRDAKAMAKKRKAQGFLTRIIPFAGRYLLYTAN